MAAAAAAIAAAIGMAGAQTTVNNQLKAATATATATVMMTATAMTMETKASTAVEAHHCSRGTSGLLALGCRWHLVEMVSVDGVLAGAVWCGTIGKNDDSAI